MSHNSQSLVTRRIVDRVGLSGLQQAWEALVDRVPSATIYQTWQWNACWWEQFGEAYRLLVVACFRGENLVGVAPMLRVGSPDAADSGGDLRFIGCPNHASDYPDFIVDPGAPAALGLLLQTLIGELGGRDRLWLSRFREDFPNRERTVDWLRRNGASFTVEADLPAPCRKLGDRAADRRAAAKDALRRYYNLLQREGQLEFQLCRRPTEILDMLDAFFDQHTARWGQTRSRSQFLRAEQRRFYRALVPALGARGWLHFTVLRLDGVPVAFHFGFEFRNRVLYYKPSFEPSYAKFSPGMVLIKFLLEDAISRDLDEFDFTVGGEAYKYRFANMERRTWRIVVFRSRGAFAANRVRVALRQFLRRARQFARRFQQRSRPR